MHTPGSCRCVSGLQNSNLNSEWGLKGSPGALKVKKQRLGFLTRVKTKDSGK